MIKSASGAVALDAMGGDHAPAATVQGAVDAVRQFGLQVLLVGREAVLRRQLARIGGAPRGLHVVDAPDVVAMDDPPTVPIRTKRNSSMAVAARLVRDGKACAFVTAGNSGAAMIAAKLIIGTIAGVERPALAAPVPGIEKPTLVLDVGANVDCKPHHLEQFGVMGHFYSQAVLGVERPRIGLLSIGEEEGKGDRVTVEAYRLLSDVGFNFIGNVEGRDVYAGTVDVVVCDGFVGNVVLKASEGLAQMIGNSLKEEFSRNIFTKLGALMALPAIRAFKRRFDHRRYNGASLLGLKGIVVKSHGSADALAFFTALERAAEAARQRLPEKIASRMAQAMMRSSHHRRSKMLAC